jgi:hypothetical protein
MRTSRLDLCSCARRRPVAVRTAATHTRGMTMPEPDEPRDAPPFGSEAAPPGDPDSQGGAPGPADGVAGPSWPPAESEPDAHR